MESTLLITTESATEPIAATAQPPKVYNFRGSSYALHPAVMTTRGGGNAVAVHYLTPSTYGRFVTLANSGNYDVRVVDDGSFGWTLRR